LCLLCFLFQVVAPFQIVLFSCGSSFPISFKLINNMTQSIQQLYVRHVLDICFSK
jgi:hypothetical protein